MTSFSWQPNSLLERRRFPRTRTADWLECELNLSMPARLLDVSAAGVLLLAGARLDVGQSGQLRAMLGADPFAAHLRVCRIEASPSAGAEGSALGAVFLSMDSASRAALRRLVGMSEPPPAAAARGPSRRFAGRASDRRA